MNGVARDDGGRAHSPGIASLANLGNTCFLNSVLYTLRFTPGFCHSLHHLHQDLADTRPDRDSEQECLLDMIQTLHHLFQKLCSSDSEGGTEPREPVLPSALLHSIGRLCPLFEGNQQQDAHELLVTLLTSLQDVQLPEPAPSIQPPDCPDGQCSAVASPSPHRLFAQVSTRLTVTVTVIVTVTVTVTLTLNPRGLTITSPHPSPYLTHLTSPSPHLNVTSPHRHPAFSFSQKIH
jgi:hypothetical protein